MPGVSNYPSGFPNGLTVRGVPIMQSHPGKVFWVNNSSVLAEGGIGGSNGNNGTYTKPWSTIDYAIGRCKAGRGDIIMVMPGHSETITAAGGITLDVDGVAIVGLGSGNYRPLLTYTTANTASVSWTADSCTMKNIRFVGNFLSIATAILNSGGRDWTVEGCDFSDTSATLGFLAAVTTTVSTNSDNGWFCDNRRSSDATTTPGTALKIANTTNRLTIKDNVFWHSVIEENVSPILAHGALVVDELLMTDNIAYSVNAAQTTAGFLVSTSATTGSGILARNFVRSVDPSAAIMVTATAVQYGLFENYHQGDTTSLQGYLLPAAGSDA
jgi:hypothetical protein